MKCHDCKDDMPDDLVQEICLNGKYRSVCGVCALKAVRLLHGMPNYMFGGEMAKSIYDRSVAWKKKHAKKK